MWNASWLAGGQNILRCKMHSGSLGKLYSYAKCTLACWQNWAEYTLMQNAFWFAGQNIHVCKMHPGLLGRIYMYAKCTLACRAEYTYMQKGPWIAGWNKHVQSASWLVGQNILRCKMHPGLLGRIYLDAKCILARWANYIFMLNAP